MPIKETAERPLSFYAFNLRADEAILKYSFTLPDTKNQGKQSFVQESCAGVRRMAQELQCGGM